jgi:hypothetical protein
MYHHNRGATALTALAAVVSRMSPASISAGPDGTRQLVSVGGAGASRRRRDAAWQGSA